MSIFASTALFLAAGFSSLSPAQQQRIDCLAVMTIASTEANESALFGIPNMDDRVARFAQIMGTKAVKEYGLGVDEFTSIYTDRLMKVMMRNTGGSQRIAKIRPQVNACKKYLPR